MQSGDSPAENPLPIVRAAEPIADNGEVAPEPSQLNGANGAHPGEGGADDAPTPSLAETRRIRRAAARVEAGKRPRKPRSAPATEEGAREGATPVPGEMPEPAPEGDVDALSPDHQPHIAFTDSGKRGARTVRRASKTQKAAAVAVNASDDNPALGALNRHLNTMTQQLTTAHRVIGRVAAERDALRQQLADLQGIPVEEIVVSTVGASTEASAQPTSTRSSQPASPAEPSRFAKLNYFGGEDVAVMKKRRQMFALAILVVIAMVWVAIRTGYIAMSESFSRESLTAIPLIGEIMPLFLAGWILFRMIKISSKGVRWVFPSEDQRRRRR